MDGIHLKTAVAWVLPKDPKPYFLHPHMDFCWLGPWLGIRLGDLEKENGKH